MELATAGGHYYCYACRCEVLPDEVNEDQEHDRCGCTVGWSEDEIDIEEG